MNPSLPTRIRSLSAVRCTLQNITIRPIETQEDLWYAVQELTLTPAQRDFVNPPGFSIGRAWLWPEKFLPCVICRTDGTRIGFIVFSPWLAEGDGVSFGYMIDLHHQHKGYGTAAARLALQMLREVCPDLPVKLAVETDNHRAQALYASLGFVLLDEKDGNDLVYAHYAVCQK